MLCSNTEFDMMAAEKKIDAGFGFSFFVMFALLVFTHGMLMSK